MVFLQVGDIVTYEQRSYVLRGFQPMSIPDRNAYLEDAETGRRIHIPLRLLERAHFRRGGAGGHPREAPG